ncbi:hypothetical protein FI667_g10428, partial [Globisporangium splendens]
MEDGDDGKRGLQVVNTVILAVDTQKHINHLLCESNSALLGLTPQALRDGLGLSDEQQVRAHEESARLILLPRIERKLRLKCNELCDIMLPDLQQALNGADTTMATKPSASSTTSLSRIAELPALLVEVKARKHHVEEETKQLETHIHAQLLQDLKRCSEMTTRASQLLVDHKRNDQPRVLLAKLQYLAAVSKAMQLKAQVLSHELAVETYPSEKLDVLRASHAELQRRKAKALEERDAVTTCDDRISVVAYLQAKLHLYQHADAQYQSIAKEYGVVLQHIEEKKNWLTSLDV